MNNLEWLMDYTISFFLPLMIFFLNNKIGMAYIGCSVLFALVRIGNILRDKK
jgi:hypothetical protein